MIIDLKSIQGVPRRFEFTLEPDWWQPVEDGQVLGLETPLEARISIYRAGNKYVLDGQIAARLRVRCDRCLDPCSYDLGQDFRLFLAPPPESNGIKEVELQEEALDLDFLSGDEVDTDQVIQEQIFYSLPIKTLCGDNCLGLCPLCGANLNREKCGCVEKEGHSAFQKLKSLKLTDS